MKIAIINQESSTGGWNFLCLLLEGIKKVNPKIELRVFSNIVPEDYASALKRLNIEIIDCKFINYHPKEFYEKNKFKGKFANNTFNKIRLIFFNINRLFEKNRDEILKQLNNFDLIFYSWPYGIEPLEADIPMFFISHDFILSHFFGSYFGNNTYTKSTWEKTRSQMEKFFKKGTPIVSTPFIKSEVTKIFPQYGDNVNVVFLSKLNSFKELKKDEIKEILTKYDINKDYILCANNAQLHKNLGQVISAYYYVKQKYPDIKLIITGHKSEDIICKSNNHYYADFLQGNEEYDIKAIGELSQKEFSAILQGAKMVINASLCEAGSGSGLDAWSVGVPLVMSNIPAFKQQLDFLNTKAELFDPRNSSDIARAIIYLLENHEIAESNAKTSKEALEKYTWENVAEQYIEIFSKHLDKTE